MPLPLGSILDAQTRKKLGIPVLAGIGTNPGIGRYWCIDGMPSHGKNASISYVFYALFRVQSWFECPSLWFACM